MAGISMILLLCLITGELFASTMGTDYCHVRSCGTRPHTMCRWTSPRPARRCGHVGRVGLSNAEKAIIVNTHNRLRRKVASGNEKRGAPGPQPPAVSMPNLTWDNELAKVAQKWANQCNFAHDQCRNVGRFVVGQNIAMRASTSTGKSNKTLINMIYSWYNEVGRFNRNQVSRYVFSMHTGHYTQVVWAKTLKLGCGLVEYKKFWGGRPWNTYYLVCNYGPAGNWMGQEMYKIRH